jgi:hypothetical protein
MKKYLLIAIFIAGACRLNAQPAPPSPEERMRHTKEIIKQDVNPGADQLTKIEEAYKLFFDAMDKLRKENPPPPPPPIPAKVKETMDKLVKERDDKIKTILNAEQYKKYQEAAKKLHPPKPGDKNGAPPPPDSQK